MGTLLLLSTNKDVRASDGNSQFAEAVHDDHPYKKILMLKAGSEAEISQLSHSSFHSLYASLQCFHRDQFSLKYLLPFFSVAHQVTATGLAALVPPRVVSCPHCFSHSTKATTPLSTATLIIQAPTWAGPLGQREQPAEAEHAQDFGDNGGLFTRRIICPWFLGPRISFLCTAVTFFSN